ncbi:MAG: ATP-dependent helicase [Lachnospiraceae bacterium]|uniref:DNA 3'-5' helicase n=1 Tax=Hominiventricola filiformis TaxID=2885352 RepID=A0AAE3ACN7_9FIRM|nr:ATP-dependent helicase [Hominiventricola filiformis]MCC2127556.1 ATP-dependent helicase [Hominiventricola filiformis]MDY3825986.1 ATP-dependent helicase [Lachnospiraceae bacterium]
MSSFTKSQSEAIRHQDGPLLVLAGPGSGKTTVVTKRVQYLVQDCHISPSSILVITFTKAAATEMKERFLRLMEQSEEKPQGYGNVLFGTFHAVFFNILKLSYGFTAANILREETRYQYMKEIVDRLKLEIDDENEFISGVLGEISLIKNERISLEHYFSKNCAEDIFRKIFASYEQRKRNARLIDFDDMLSYTWELLTKRPDILEAWQKKFRYILVDEFQDINRLQYDILRLLAQPENNLFIVGDDDQSIYRFRGAKPEIMLNFQKDFPTAGRVLLNDNFRSTRQIVNAAGRVIRKNQSRFAKEITARGGEGPGVRILAFEDQQQECLYLLKEMQEYKKNGGAWQQMAVLYRTNTQPRLLIQKFMEFNVPFRVRDQVPNLFEHWIAKNLFCYIRLACGSKLRKDLLPVLNRPKRYMNRECLNDEIICWEYMMDYYKDKPYVCDKIERLQYDLKMLGRMGPFAAINYIRHVMGYEEYLKEYAEFRRMNAEDLMEVLNELQESARAYKTYDEWFAYMERYKKEMDEMRKRQQEVKEGVHLATMHSSKGLEYDKVFILDAAEGITPYKKAVLDADLEEERRMFYVAMTRAKKELTICWAKKQFSHELTVSRFVEEMKDDRAV